MRASSCCALFVGLLPLHRHELTPAGSSRRRDGARLPRNGSFARPPKLLRWEIMAGSNGSSSGVSEVGRRFNGVKVISATMVADRQQLGERVTAWIASRPECKVTDIVVTQSSDEAFHCIAFTIFYWEDRADE
jgi:hypothetical protein